MRLAAGPFARLPAGAFGLCLDPEAPNRAAAALTLDIPDYGLPDPARLRATLDALRAAMAAQPGRLFYIGCRAGLGRTGTVLACLAAECGAPGDPVAWVRARHDPRAVETPAQEGFARGWLRDRLRMPAAEDPQGIFRSGKARSAADAGCIGKLRNAAGAEKTRGADPSGVLKRSLRPSRW